MNQYISHKQPHVPQRHPLHNLTSLLFWPYLRHSIPSYDRILRHFLSYLRLRAAIEGASHPYSSLLEGFYADATRDGKTLLFGGRWAVFVFTDATPADILFQAIRKVLKWPCRQLLHGQHHLVAFELPHKVAEMYYHFLRGHYHPIISPLRYRRWRWGSRRRHMLAVLEGKHPDTVRKIIEKHYGVHVPANVNYPLPPPFDDKEIYYLSSKDLPCSSHALLLAKARQIRLQLKQQKIKANL